MNNLAGNNLTLGLSKNDLAAAISWLTLARGPTERGNSRSRLTQTTEGLTAHAMCENTFARRPGRSGYQSDHPMRSATSYHPYCFEPGLRSRCPAAHPILT
jgi:hypothetical protein